MYKQSKIRTVSKDLKSDSTLRGFILKSFTFHALAQYTHSGAGRSTRRKSRRKPSH